MNLKNTRLSLAAFCSWPASSPSYTKTAPSATLCFGRPRRMAPNAMGSNLRNLCFICFSSMSLRFNSGKSREVKIIKLIRTTWTRMLFGGREFQRLETFLRTDIMAIQILKRKGHEFWTWFWYCFHSICTSSQKTTWPSWTPSVPISPINVPPL